MSVSAWEAIFMLVVLKIPLVYIALVIWWAIRGEPGGPPADGGDEAGVLTPLTPCGWNEWRRRRSLRAPSRPIRPSGHVRPPARARVT